MTCSINCNMWGAVHKTFTWAVAEVETKKTSKEATWFKWCNSSLATRGWVLPLCLDYWTQRRRLSPARHVCFTESTRLCEPNTSLLQTDAGVLRARDQQQQFRWHSVPAAPFLKNTSVCMSLAQWEQTASFWACALICHDTVPFCSLKRVACSCHSALINYSIELLI